MSGQFCRMLEVRNSAFQQNLFSAAVDVQILVAMSASEKA